MFMFVLLGTFSSSAPLLRFDRCRIHITVHRLFNVYTVHSTHRQVDARVLSNLNQHLLLIVNAIRQLAEMYPFSNYRLIELLKRLKWTA